MNETMTIRELEDRKRLLEEVITNEILRFTEVTGITVGSVELNHVNVQAMDEARAVYRLNGVDVGLLL